MYCIFNNEILPENSLLAHPLQRGFSYGDGVFETCLYANGEVHFLDAHLTRLRTGCQILSLIPNKLAMDRLVHNINQLVKENNLGTMARIKILVIRENGGFYASTSDRANVLITATASNGIEQVEAKADISRKVILQSSAWSGIKTINALPYVMAGIEKRDRGWGEILLCNANGKVIEAGSSNLIVFNEYENTIGLVEPRPYGIRGIMFEEISFWLVDAKLPYEINPIYQQPFQRLKRATSILCCNSVRLTWLTQIEDVPLNPAPLQKILAPLLANFPMAQ